MTEKTLHQRPTALSRLGGVLSDVVSRPSGAIGLFLVVFHINDICEYGFQMLSWDLNIFYFLHVIIYMDRLNFLQKVFEDQKVRL